MLLLSTSAGDHRPLRGAGAQRPPGEARVRARNSQAPRQRQGEI